MKLDATCQKGDHIAPLSYLSIENGPASLLYQEQTSSLRLVERRRPLAQASHLAIDVAWTENLVKRWRGEESKRHVANQRIRVGRSRKRTINGPVYPD